MISNLLRFPSDTFLILNIRLPFYHKSCFFSFHKEHHVFFGFSLRACTRTEFGRASAQLTVMSWALDRCSFPIFGDPNNATPFIALRASYTIVYPQHLKLLRFPDCHTRFCANFLLISTMNSHRRLALSTFGYYTYSYAIQSHLPLKQNPKRIQLL